MGAIQLINSFVQAFFDDQQSNSYVILPAPAATTFAVTMGSVTTAANWTTWGTTLELVASVAADYWITHLYVKSATVGTYAELQIGIGASGSEVWQQALPVKAGDANLMQIYTLPIPIFAPSGSRVAIRGRGSAGTAFTVAVGAAAGLSRRS